MKGKIVYRFTSPVYPANILYVNLVKKYSCTNDCLFCSRPRTKKEFGKENIYENKAGTCLYLDKSPSVEQVLREIYANIKPDDKEIAFVGLGEPLIQFNKIVKIIKQIKQKYPKIKTRIDTNGTVRSMYKDAVKHLESAELDEVRISLNAINKQEYNKLCRPKLHDAFSNIISFIKECVNSNIDTHISFVTEFKHPEIKYRTKQEFIDFALSLGIKKENIILRKYVEAI